MKIIIEMLNRSVDFSIISNRKHIADIFFFFHHNWVSWPYARVVKSYVSGVVKCEILLRSEQQKLKLQKEDKKKSGKSFNKYHMS